MPLWPVFLNKDTTPSAFKATPGARVKAFVPNEECTPVQIFRNCMSERRALHFAGPVTTDLAGRCNRTS
jgi:hypothetical protein